MGSPARQREWSGRREPHLVLTRTPPPPRKPRRRRFHIAAIFAAALYFAGAYVAYELYRAAWHGEGRFARGSAEVEGAGAAPAEPQAPATPAVPTQERAAMRALAARAQQSVYELETPLGGGGSAFVAWVRNGNSFVLTAHAAVADALREGGRTVFVRRGQRSWTGRVIRVHRPNGLALVRVDTELGRPLWQQRGRTAKLAPGAVALVVPAGPAPIGEGAAGAQQRGRIPVQAPPEETNLGAPVLGRNGRIAGVVTRTGPRGVNRVVPIEAACAAGVRRCG